MERMYDIARRGKNLRTILDNPEIAPHYLAYWVKKLLPVEGGPRRSLAPSGVLGGFGSFSEYLKLPNCIEIHERSFLQNALRVLEQSSGGRPVIFDVGANLGVFSLYVSSVVPQAKIFTFEPGPSTFKSLELNMRINKRSKVNLLRLAVGNVDGEIGFDASLHSRATAKISGSSGLKVGSVRLDSFCQREGIQKIELLKVDVEGYEDAVFEGAKGLLQEQRVELLYFEFCPGNEISIGKEVGSAVRILSALGYKVWTLTPAALLTAFEADQMSPNILTNLVAVSGAFRSRNPSLFLVR